MKILKCRKNVEKEIGLCRVVCLHKLLVLCYHASYQCELIPKNSLTFFDNVDRNQITICLRPILTNIKVMKCPFLDIKTWKNCQINHILCTIYLQTGLGPKKIVLLFEQFSPLSFSLLPIKYPYNHNLCISIRVQLDNMVLEYCKIQFNNFFS